MKAMKAGSSEKYYIRKKQEIHPNICWLTSWEETNCELTYVTPWTRALEVHSAKKMSFSLLSTAHVSLFSWSFPLKDVLSPCVECLIFRYLNDSLFARYPAARKCSSWHIYTDYLSSYTVAIARGPWSPELFSVCVTMQEIISGISKKKKSWFIFEVRPYTRIYVKIKLFSLMWKVENWHFS